jgi:hypothetical protein
MLGALIRDHLESACLSCAGYVLCDGSRRWFQGQYMRDLSLWSALRPRLACRSTFSCVSHAFRANVQEQGGDAPSIE